MDNYNFTRNTNRFASAALIMSIIGICTFFCGYISIICGSLGIVFALLSKGGGMTYASTAKIALIIGIFACIASAAVITISILIVVQQAGGIDGLLQQYNDIYSILENGGSYEDIYSNMYNGLYM